MAGEDFEIDFLASTQLGYDPDSFARVVKEAFQLEHSCVENQDIAEVLGVDKSRVTQILSSPERLRPDSINGILEHLENDKNRYRILWSWIRESTGIDIRALPGGRMVTRSINATALDRFSGQIKEGRHLFTATEAFRAAMNTNDRDLREGLLDQAFFAQKKLATPGRAMKTARVIVEGAMERDEPARVSAGLLFRALILLDAPDLKVNEISQIVDLAGRNLDCAKEPQSESYVTATRSVVDNFRIGATLTFMERGSIVAETGKIECILENLLKSLQVRTLKHRDRFQKHLYASRSYVLLGKAFQAEEHLDKAFAVAKRKHLDATELCAPVRAALIKLTEPRERLGEFLTSATESSLNNFDLEFRRKVEWELALFENESFPC